MSAVAMPCCCRMADAQVQQLLQLLERTQEELLACKLQSAETEGELRRLRLEVAELRLKVAELRAELAGARESRKRQRVAADAAGGEVTDLQRRLANCEEARIKLEVELIKLRDAERRRSSGGSHPMEDQQQPPQQPAQKEELAAGVAAEGGAGSGDAAAAE